MSQQLVIPDRAIPYILFQRTAYLRFPVIPVYRFFHRLGWSRTPLYNLVVAIEARINGRRVKHLYAMDLQHEYQSIQSALPPHCSALLDIGAGVSGIDVLLYRHYHLQMPQLYLLDKSHIEGRVFYLFERRGAFYNSLEVARELLLSNGIPHPAIHLLEANEQNEIGLNRPVDLVISLLSWGFHYPIETYVARVAVLLSETGVVITDVRKGTDGIARLQQHFPNIMIIQDTHKYQRVAGRR